MSLPVTPPVRPMLGLLAEELPDGDGWWFEPKWDGFRVIVFRDGADLELRSRDDKPLLRYFPELAEPLRAALPARCVADGEIVIARDGALDFEALQMRLHPAKSRIDKLAGEIPAGVVLWDLLALGDRDLRDEPLDQRRALLAAQVRERPAVRLTPGATDRAVAADWLARFEGAGFDGVMAKRLDGTYLENKRALVKVKHVRTLDCVVAGFRWHKNGHGTEVGSLVLAMFDDEGRLHPIGVCSSFSAKRRRTLLEELAPLRDGAAVDHPWAEWLEGHEHRPDVKSRWASDRSLDWEPVRLERVAEVKTTQHSGRRLRHPAKLVRWRHDKPVEACTMDQLHIAPAAELAELFR